MPLTFRINQPKDGFNHLPRRLCQYDNISYLTYGSAEPPQVAVRASNPRTSLILRSASQTEQGELSNSLPLNGFTKKDLLSRKVVIHQGEINSDVEKILEEFVFNGVALSYFPPETTSSGDSTLLSWYPIEEKLEDEIFQVNNWREDSGILANSSDGKRLPLDRLNIKKRRIQNKVRLLPITRMGSPFFQVLFLEMVLFIPFPLFLSKLGQIWPMAMSLSLPYKD